MKRTYLTIFAVVALCAGMHQLQAMHSEEMKRINRRISVLKYKGNTERNNIEMSELYARKRELERLDVEQAARGLRQMRQEPQGRDSDDDEFRQMQQEPQGADSDDE